jgi:hypothetical protein
MRNARRIAGPTLSEERISGRDGQRRWFPSRRIDVVEGTCDTNGACRRVWWRCSLSGSIYRTPEGEAEIRALYDEALVELGLGYESLTVGTRLGDTHVIAIGDEGVPPEATRLRHGRRRAEQSRPTHRNSPASASTLTPRSARAARLRARR